MADVVDYVLNLIGVGSTDAMAPQARLRYKEATGDIISGGPSKEEEEAAKLLLNKPDTTPQGQVNLESNRRREELKKEELVTLLARQKSISDKAKRGEYK